MSWLFSFSAVNASLRPAGYVDTSDPLEHSRQQLIYNFANSSITAAMIIQNTTCPMWGRLYTYIIIQPLLINDRELLNAFLLFAGNMHKVITGQ